MGFRERFRVDRISPAQLRAAYDLIITSLGAATAGLFSRLWSQDVSRESFVGLCLTPSVYLAVASALGLYGARRQSSIRLKVALLAVVLSSVVALQLLWGVEPVLSALWMAGVIGPLMLPRVLVGMTFSRESGYLSSAIRANGPVLVVGGAGYIGSEVVRQLLGEGRRVRVLDKLVYGRTALAPYLEHPGFELVDGDTTDIAVLTNAMYGVSAVVHLAGLVGDPACSVDENFTRHLNIISTRMVKEVAKSLGIRRFVFASSCSVYGISAKVLDETSEINPISLYARTKIDSERELLESASPTFNPVILRFATVFGHSGRPRFDLVANLFTAQAYFDGQVKVFGSGQWRPFVHVRDVARAVVMALTAKTEKVSGQIFNVGDSRLNLTIGQLAEVVEKVVSPVRAVVRDVRDADFKDARNYAVSFDKIRRVLGYQATVTIEDGVRDMLEQMQSGVYLDYRDPSFSNVEITRRIVTDFYDPELASKMYTPVTTKGAATPFFVDREAHV